MMKVLRRVAVVLLVGAMGACGSSDGNEPGDTSEVSGDVPSDVSPDTAPDTSGDTAPDVEGDSDSTSELGPDTVAGTIAVLAPTDGSCLNSGVLTVSGTATDLDGVELGLVGTGPDGVDGAIDADLATVSAGAWSGTFNVGADGAYDLSVTTEQGVSSASFDIVVDRVAPVVGLDLPSRIDGLAVLDADDTVVGFQYTIDVSVAEATSLLGTTAEVCLAINGAEPTCLPMATSVSFVVTLDTGDNAIVATARDGCANASEPTSHTLTLAFDNPVALVAPVPGVLLARADADLATTAIMDTTFTVEANRGVVGSLLEVSCRPIDGAGWLAVGSLEIQDIDPSYDIPVALDTTVLGTDIECRAAIDLPASGTSAPVAFTVGLPAPSLSIAAPPACINGDFAASGTASGLDGRTATLSFDDTTVTAEVAIAAGAWSTTLVLGALADGAYTMTAAATDGFGNALADHSPPSLPVVVDRTRPVVAFVLPAGPVDGTDDVAPGVPGMQVDVSVSFVDALAGEVCLTLDGGSLGCREVVPAAAAPIVFEAVTIQGGTNAFIVTGRDACDNAATAATVELLHVTEAPVVTITSPAADLTTAAASLDVVVTVTEPDRTTALPGLAVRLFAGGTDLGLTPVDVGDGSYRFDDVQLAPGVATSFTAHAPRPGSVGVSGPRVVTQKDVAPQITLTSPMPGTLNLASPECAPGVDCAMTVTATTTDAEDGSLASLDVTCGATTVQVDAQVANNAVVFPVTLAHGQSCVLAPSVTDLVGQAETGTPVAVSIDRVAPTAATLAPSPVVLSIHDLDATTAGIQTALSATFGGLEAGIVVTAELSYTEAQAPATRTLTHTIATATADGATYTAAFEDAAGTGLVTWPAGVVVVRFTASDRAGNPVAANRLVTVDADASVRITSPTTALAPVCGGVCATGAVCHVGTCWLSWGTNSTRQFIAVVAGLDTTSNNLRVCSDAPAFAVADAPACDSVHPSGGVFRQAHITTASVGINLLDVSQMFGAGAHRVVVEVRPVDGGAWLSSHTAVTVSEREKRVFLDLTAPVVTSVASPSDTLMPIGTLSAAEQVTTPRIFNVAFATDKAGSAELFVNGTSASTQAVAVGSTTVSATLPEGTPQVWVVVTDAAGNRSRLTPALGATTFQPTVDVTPPTLSFSRPNTSPLKAGDNLDVTLTTNAEGRTVTVFDNGVSVATATVTGGVASFPHATFGLLSDGEHHFTAAVSDAANNPRTAVTNPAMVFVDTLPPLGTIVSPENGTGLTDFDDADSSAPGFQVAVDFSTTRGAVSWSLWTASSCNIIFQSCDAAVVRASGAVTNPDGPEAQRVLTLDLDAIATQHKVILQTVDALGNVHTVESGVQVLVTSCAISFRQLPASGWFNGDNCDTPPACATATVEVQVGFVGLCGANRLRLFKDDVQVGDDLNNPAPLVSFFLDVDDGESFALEARAFNGESVVGSTGPSTLEVDLQPPVTRFMAGQVGDFTTPAHGESVEWAVADDLDPNAAGAQFHALVEVSDTNIDGGAVVSMTATSGASTVALSPSNGAFPLTLTGTSTVTRQLLDMTLVSGSTHNVTVTARDVAGNRSSSSFIADVDVVAPGAVALSQTDADPRGPRVTLQWTAVGGDGMTGLPAAYEVRYSPSPLTVAAWDAACDASAVFGSEAIGPPVAAGSNMTVTFGGPDTRPMSDPCKLDHIFQDAQPGTEPALYWGVRAVDAAGNLSALGASSLWTATREDIASRTSRVKFSNANSAFGATSLTLLTRRGAIIGDIDNDGIADWAVGSRNSQAFCIVRGRDDHPGDVTFDTLSSADHACLLGTQASALFTGATQTGHFVRALGDVNGDGIADFGVAGKLVDSAANSGLPGEAYVVVYFGRAGALPDLTAPNLRFRGIRSRAGSLEYLGFCGAGDFDGAVTNARTTSDLAIGEAFDSKLHVIPGQGTWDLTTNLTFNLATAGTLVSLGAWSVQTTGTWGAASPSPAQLGVRCAPAGDLLPTPAGMGSGAKDDLIVYQQGSLDARVFVFAGRDIVAGTVELVSECVTGDCSTENPPAVTPEDARSVRLRQDTVGMITGYGGAITGRVDLTGDGVPEVIATHPGRSVGATGTPDGKSIFIFDGAKVAALVGQDVRVTSSGDLIGQAWTGTNGWVLRASVTSQPLGVVPVGNFDGWVTGATPRETFDLAIGNLSGTLVELRLNHDRVGASLVPGQFAVVDGEVSNRFSSASSAIGQWIDGGQDLDGDGRDDLITGGNVGDVIIVH